MNIKKIFKNIDTETVSRTEPFNMRLTEFEKKNIKRASAKLGISMSAFTRTLALGAADEILSPGNSKKPRK